MKVEVWFWTKRCWILKMRVKSWRRMIEEAGEGGSKKEMNLNRDILFALECKKRKRDHGCHQLWRRGTSGANTQRM